MMNFFKEDIRRHFTPSELSKGLTFWQMARKVIHTETLWIVMCYRYGRWVHTTVKGRILKTLLKFPYSVIGRTVEIILGVVIPIQADIGKGLYIGHYGGIWIGPIRMGSWCNISQDVTIGVGGTGENRGIPEVGSRVYFGPGAKVFGKIKIGNNVAIGANAVVSKSLPDNAVVLGNPGRIISYEGSTGLIEIQDDVELVRNSGYYFQDYGNTESN